MLRCTDGACVSVYNTQRYLCNLPATTAHRLLRKQLPQPPLGRMSSYTVRRSVHQIVFLSSRDLDQSGALAAA